MPLHFCTVFCARLRHEAGGIDCRFANGGHVAPLLLRHDGAVEEVDRWPRSPRRPVQRREYQGATLRLEPGDLLLLYTDGITEVSRSDATRGEQELRATLARVRRPFG